MKKEPIDWNSKSILSAKCQMTQEIRVETLAASGHEFEQPPEKEKKKRSDTRGEKILRAGPHYITIGTQHVAPPHPTRKILKIIFDGHPTRSPFLKKKKKKKKIFFLSLLSFIVTFFFLISWEIHLQAAVTRLCTRFITLGLFLCSLRRLNTRTPHPKKEKKRRKIPFFLSFFFGGGAKIPFSTKKKLIFGF